MSSGFMSENKSATESTTSEVSLDQEVAMLLKESQEQASAETSSESGDRTHPEAILYGVSERMADISVSAPGDNAATSNGVSYVQILPEGWAWYSLVTRGSAPYELRLVQTNIPNFVFQTRIFDDADGGNAEAIFSQMVNEQGLMYVDTSPALSFNQCDTIAALLRELTQKKQLLENLQAEQSRAWRRWRFFATLAQWLHITISVPYIADRVALESEIEALHSRLREACFQAEEEIRGGDTVSTPTKQSQERLQIIIQKNSSGYRQHLLETLMFIASSESTQMRALAQIRDIPLTLRADIPEAFRQPLEQLYTEAGEAGFPFSGEETIGQFLSSWAAFISEKDV
jgi:hypothetical protein